MTSSPSIPKPAPPPPLPPPPEMPEPVEQIQVVEQEEADVKRKTKKFAANKGRQGNIFAGLQNVLEQRVGQTGLKGKFGA